MPCWPGRSTATGCGRSTYTAWAGPCCVLGAQRRVVDVHALPDQLALRHPVNHAANFGRAFIYIAILTPLFAAGMQRRDTRSALFVVAGAWSLVISGASIAGSIHQSSFTVHLLHVLIARRWRARSSRLYVHAEDLLVVALMFSIPFLLGATRKAQRWFAGAGGALRGGGGGGASDACVLLRLRRGGAGRGAGLHEQWRSARLYQAAPGRHRGAGGRDHGGIFLFAPGRGS